MSQGQALRWAEAHAVATRLVGELADACERIEIAGSLRRRKAEVHDIEIVAIPRVERRLVTDLLFTEERDEEVLSERIFAARPDLAPRAVEIHRRDGTVETGQRMGAAYKALVYRGMAVDLFVTDRERWGCIYALRTGPGDWNTRLVADFFAALGVPWIAPQDRTVERLWMDPDLLRGDPL